MVNALRAVTSEDAAAREDMWRRHWDLHNAESQKRLDALHAAQASAPRRNLRRLTLPPPAARCRMWWGTSGTTQ